MTFDLKFAFFNALVYLHCNILLVMHDNKYRLKTKTSYKSHGEIFLRIKVLFIFWCIMWSVEGEKTQNYGAP